MESSKISLSPLVNYYHNRENEWSALINTHIPGATLLRWGSDHRVFKYKKRVFKIEKSSLSKENPEQGLFNEYQVLISSKILTADLNPNYYQIENLWDVLELDFIDGLFLEDMWNKNELNNISILKIIIKVFLISISGVFYRQLRPRHIILGENRKIFFVDFGNSKKISFIAALVLNFSPIRRINYQWTVGRLAGLTYEILRSKLQDNKERKPYEYTARVMTRWLQNLTRSNNELPIHIKNKFGDINAFNNFIDMEEKMFEAVKKNPTIAFDAIEFKFDGYGMYAKRDWGYIWDSIRRKIDFHEKKIIDLGSGMGGVGAFARMEGATIAIAYDNNQTLLDASRFCSQALGYKDNIYHLSSFDSLLSGECELAKGDIIFALSSRLDNLNQDILIKLITQYNQIVFLTNNPKEVTYEFTKYGFSSVESLVKVDHKNFILYAKNRH